MEQSPNLENVEIRAWAQQIREMKIREFETYIKNLENDLSSTSLLVYGYAKARIVELKRKLEILKNTK